MMSNTKRWCFVALLLLLLPTVALVSCSGKGQHNEAGQHEAVAYPVQVAKYKKTTLTQSYPATLKGKLDVEIRPQVSGQIVRLGVDEGDVVKRGQTLFVIDPVQYQEAVNAAEATLRVAEASVATARLTAENNRALAKEDIIGPYALQTAENALLSAEAGLAQAKAQLSSARKQLSFTNITSPTDGVVGSIPLRVGSLVSPASPQPLTTVSDNSEMVAYFSMTERQLLEYSHSGLSTAELLKVMPEVQFRLMDGSIYSEKGSVETISGVLDNATGSVTVRATFPNPHNRLLSGATGEVLIPFESEDVVEVPQLATYQIQEKIFLYVVDGENVVHSREVKVLSQNDGVHYLVTSGLEQGEKYVQSGVITLRDGMKIAPTQAE